VFDDAKCKAKEQLEAALLEALQSEPERVTPEWWAKLREEVHAEASKTVEGTRHGE
jgi:hypothetical protein